MRQIINDNVPELLKLPASSLSTCKDNKEFFTLLKEKILKNINKIFDNKEIDKKIIAFTDTWYDLNVLGNELQYVHGDNPFKRLKEHRLNTVGGYKKKLVYNDNPGYVTLPLVEVKGDVARALDFGEANNWPAMVLKRDGNKIIKTLGQGEKAWLNIIAMKELKAPYDDNYNDLTESIRRKDLWQSTS